LTAPAAPSFKNKTVATLLASLGGTFGLHRFYLQGSRRVLPWLYPAFAWTLIPTFAAFIEALRFALTPDERWDAQWNATSSRTSDSGWLVILLAVLTFLGSATLLMTLISFAIGRYVGSGESFFSMAIFPTFA
jgi:TM2 domain-containing membrane protein YozV